MAYEAGAVSRRSFPLLKKMEFYKDSAIEAIRNTIEFDKKIIDSKIEYRDKISASHEDEYRLLQRNYEMAKTEEERSAIREQMSDIRRTEREEAKDYDAFADDVQSKHNEQILKILFSVAVTTGLVKVSKPLISAGKNLIKSKL